ncbi:hypothetical protein CC85DRAFT_23737 [Cutaneotrichosporon oleaginosum]|uniref:Uncharacterized protein n=1 Tax=Cutaneotrichosporon oleaginosum TaxID=879819 RepID=A0A0J0XT17_9TREE|nr:uncharacterized protein CC85DRAFT_23737 [Cutaneotrichosporon oleaginosum]KLT44216.1 hypothetical protein CC85DRAFT_23737 [Cutaneotrichosporon oleaginosum]TXT11616.1 hypothetical protein COLE_02026 [Cutaneotrichosporon oleaginosum]
MEVPDAQSGSPFLGIAGRNVATTTTRSRQLAISEMARRTVERLRSLGAWPQAPRIRADRDISFRQWSGIDPSFAVQRRPGRLPLHSSSSRSPLCPAGPSPSLVVVSVSPKDVRRCCQNASDVNPLSGPLHSAPRLGTQCSQRRARAHACRVPQTSWQLARDERRRATDDLCICAVVHFWHVGPAVAQALSLRRPTRYPVSWDR